MKKKKSNKFLPYIIGLAVILIIVLVIGKKQGWFGKDFQINVATKVVESRTITELITANGKVQPETEIKISPDVSGEIIDLNVAEGDEVKKGQLLLVIKPDIYIQQLNMSEASLSSSQARLAQADARLIESELSFKRANSLFKQEAIPVSDFETAESSYKVAQSEVKAAQFAVKSAEASVAQAQEQLVKTKIYAPMDGTISRKNVEKGERVVGTNMYAGTELLIIANLHLMEVKVDVNENDIVRVNLNDTALIEVDAYLGRKFKGIVTEIANSAKTTGVSADQVTNFDVKILVLPQSYQKLVDAGDKNPFRPGMSATVEIRTQSKHDILTVPIQSVTTRTDTTKVAGTPSQKDIRTLVFITDGKYALAKDVKTGIQDNSYIEILSGVNANDRVISAPFSAISKKLSDSTLIEVVKKEELFKVK